MTARAEFPNESAARLSRSQHAGSQRYGPSSSARWCPRGFRGTDVDWFRNLETVNQGVVGLGGRTPTVDRPRVVDIDDVIGLLPPSMVRLARLNGAREAARLRVSGPAA